MVATTAGIICWLTRGRRRQGHSAQAILGVVHARVGAARPHGGAARATRTVRRQAAIVRVALSTTSAVALVATHGARQATNLIPAFKKKHLR